jgi:nucleotide-binding universal stress UspA family protein
MPPFKEILIQVRGDSPDQAALGRATRLAAGRDAGLTLVAVVEDIPWYARLVLPRPDELLEAVVRERGRSLETLAATIRRDGISVATRVLRGRPHLEAVREVIRAGHDLLIKEAEAGRHGLFGAMDMHLLRACPCPVWLERPSSRVAPLRHILAAIDPTPETWEPSWGEVREALNARILGLAQALAEADGAELHVVYTWSAPAERLLMSRSSELPDPAARYVEDMHRAANSALAGFLDRHPSGAFRRRAHLLEGDVPADTIARFAGECEADLLVMGTVARSGISGALIGNTAEAILDQVGCSVLTVKPDNFICPVGQDEARP